MFRWKLHNNFSFYLLDDLGNLVTVQDWPAYKERYLSQFSILYELLDNGFAHPTVNTCEVEVDQLLNLNEIDRKVLGMPDTYPYEIYIQSNGQLNQNTFQFLYGFYDFTPNGSRLLATRKRAIIEIDEREYLLSKNQFLICEALDRFNSLPESERSFQNNLKCFADIKTLSKEAASLLDAYLESQHVYQPDKIKIDLELIDGIFEIIPTIEIENQSGFLKTFDQFPSIKDVYPVTDSSGTIRVVISDNQKQALSNIKQNRKIISKAIIDDIVEHPEKYFDDSAIDYSVFYSDRVKEIGVYKPKFYPFVCPYKSEWIPGIIVRDRVNGEKRIHFKTESELDELERLQRTAISIGRNSVLWKDVEIPVEDTEKFIKIGRRQFASPKEALQSGEHTYANHVLIIKENADLLEYVEDRSKVTEINHSFYQIGNLKLNIELKQHQIEGIAWLQGLHIENLCGCLLADDMGLGKTLQLLYFIEWHAQNYNHAKPYLIVAPVSLLENWESEYGKFFDPKHLPLRKLYGHVDLTKGFDDQINKRDAKLMQYKHIILTNYESLREYQAPLCLVDFAVVVLDEAQKIKTPGTLITNATKALKADFKIAMTGTPVENTLVDLWCIMDFTVPGLLGNAKDFAKEFQNPLKNEETNAKELGELLRNRIGVFIKRRLKRDVAKDLPQKFDNANSRIRRQMPPAQLERYKIELELARNTDLTGVDRRNQVLKSLWAIRDISDHPFLLESQISSFKAEDLIGSSAKLQVMLDILTEVKIKDEKAIVFADRKETQKMLQKVVYFYFELFPSIVNGDTPTTKQGEGKSKLSRQQTIDRFQENDGFGVIIMSQLAAGVGLNVTKANHVIHYTRHWNPAKEAQATDRAYRIGQQKDVHVYYPMAVFPVDMINNDGSRQKSFDEILDRLLSIKTDLATNTLFPTEQAEVKAEEMFSNVFGFQTDTKPTPLNIQQADKLNPNLFEALIAAVYSTRGFDVHLTPNSNDKGADVVAIREGESYLIQAKQTISTVDNKGVQEIVGAKNYYEQIFNEKLRLVVITNGEFTASAETIARTNQVSLLRRKDLNQMLSESGVSIQQVTKHEYHRMVKV